MAVIGRYVWSFTVTINCIALGLASMNSSVSNLSVTTLGNHIRDVSKRRCCHEYQCGIYNSSCT